MKFDYLDFDEEILLAVTFTVLLHDFYTADLFALLPFSIEKLTPKTL